MKIGIIILTLISLQTVQTKYVTKEDIDVAVSVLKEAAQDYKYDPELSLDLSKFKTKQIGKTLAFISNTEYHEHMITIDIGSKKENLIINFRDAKSEDLTKKVKFDKTLLNLQKPAIRELIHRMLIKPKQKIFFRMIEDFKFDIEEQFKEFELREEVHDDHLHLEFLSEESVVAVMKIEVREGKKNENAVISDYLIHIKFDIAVKNNYIHGFTSTFSMFDKLSVDTVFTTLKKYKNSKLFFNNLCTVSEIFKTVVMNNNFTNPRYIKALDLPIDYNNQIRMLLDYYTSTIEVVFDYEPKEKDIGRYYITVYKINEKSDGSYTTDKEPLMSINFLRHKISDLKLLIEGMHLHDALDDLCEEIFKIFTEAYNRTFKQSYPDFKLKTVEIEQKMSLKTFLAGIMQRKLRIIHKALVSHDNSNNKLVEFLYKETEGLIELVFINTITNEQTTYAFQLDDYHRDTVRKYVKMIVSTSYGVEPEL